MSAALTNSGPFLHVPAALNQSAGFEWSQPIYYSSRSLQGFRAPGTPAYEGLADFPTTVMPPIFDLPAELGEPAAPTWPAPPVIVRPVKESLSSPAQRPRLNFRPVRWLGNLVRSVYEDPQCLRGPAIGVLTAAIAGTLAVGLTLGGRDVPDKIGSYTFDIATECAQTPQVYPIECTNYAAVMSQRLRAAQHMQAMATAHDMLPH